MKKEEQCPSCDGNQTKFLFEDGKDWFVAGGDSPDYGVRFCEDCQIGYSTPFLSDEELGKHYPDDFEAYVPKKNLIGYLQKKKYCQDLKKIVRILGKRAEKYSMFEIGAGRGEFLDEAREMDFEVAGIEPGEKGVEFADKQYQISLQKGLASELVFQKKYDVIVMRHVLEHLNNPNECLKKIIENGLKDDGILFLKIPNMDSWEARRFGKFWHGYDLPRHRFHFTGKGLKKVLENLEYMDVKVIPEIVPTDFVRSMQYLRTSKLKAKLFSLLPGIIKLFIAQIFCLFCYLFSSGRMIVVAEKGKK